MIDMRFRLAELMEARGIKTAYGLMKASQGTIPMTTANRLVKEAKTLRRLDFDTLEALCDVFEVEPSDLFERETRKARAKSRR